MYYAVISEDFPNSLPLRLETRPKHLARLEQLKAEGRLLLAGPHPAIDAENPGEAGFSGSLVIILLFVINGIFRGAGDVNNAKPSQDSVYAFGEASFPLIGPAQLDLNSINVSGAAGTLHVAVENAGRATRHNDPSGVLDAIYTQSWAALGTLMSKVPAPLSIGTPCDISSDAIRLRRSRRRFALIDASPVGPSTPLFQLRLWFSPSWLCSPLASLCLTL